MAGRQQLFPNPHMPLKYHTAVGLTPLKHLMKPLKPQYLKLASQPEQNADQQEHPGPINPRDHNESKHNPIQCDAGAEKG